MLSPLPTPVSSQKVPSEPIYTPYAEEGTEHRTQKNRTLFS
jgi:hypothetical protein